MQSVWHELINQARNQDKLRGLLGQVGASGQGVAARLRELTADTPVVEAPAGTLQPAWRGFADRGELERQIFDEPTLLDVAFLQRGVELAPAVARILVTMPGGRYYGTAFRIGEDLLLTNHHVLFDPADTPAIAVEAWLHYELDVRVVSPGRPSSMRWPGFRRAPVRICTASHAQVVRGRGGTSLRRAVGLPVCWPAVPPPPPAEPPAARRG